MFSDTLLQFDHIDLFVAGRTKSQERQRRSSQAAKPIRLELSPARHSAGATFQELQINILLESEWA
jgi:hypothetical protein